MTRRTVQIIEVCHGIHATNSQDGPYASGSLSARYRRARRFLGGLGVSARICGLRQGCLFGLSNSSLLDIDLFRSANSNSRLCRDNRGMIRGFAFQPLPANSANRTGEVRAITVQRRFMVEGRFEIGRELDPTNSSAPLRFALLFGFHAATPRLAKIFFLISSHSR